MEILKCVKNRAVRNLPDSCVQPHYSKINVAHNQQYLILKENQYTVSGTLWHCQMKYITTVVTKNLFGFGAIEKTVSEQWVPLNREQCIEMKQKKFCGLEQNKMVCNQDSCIYPARKRETEYKVAYLGTETYHEAECEFKSDTLVAAKLSSKIFIPNQRDNTICLASDLKCFSRTGVAIWSSDAIHQCPFSFVETANLTRQNDIFLDFKGKKLYQIQNTVKICNQSTAFVTAQGFYITQDDNVVLLPQSNVDSQLITRLIVSETDFNQNELFNIIMNMYQVTNSKMCQLFRSFANIYTKLEKEFFIFNDYNGNEAVIYTDQGRIFVPDCVIINKFKLLEKTEKCYKDFPITFKRNNKTIKAFLTQDKIIKLNSDEVSCQSLYRTCHLRSMKKVIVKIGKVNKLEDEDIFMLLNFNLELENITFLNFKHDTDIIRGIRTNENKQMHVNNEGFSVSEIKETDSLQLKTLIKIDKLATDYASLEQNVKIAVFFIFLFSVVILIICRK